jgi:hypothetical protein
MSNTETAAIRELFIEDLGRIVGGNYPADPSGPTGGSDGGTAKISTAALGEEGGCSAPHITTLAMGEEGGGQPKFVPV